MKLWLVRHASPLIAPGMCYGRLDVEADAAATQASATALAAVLPQALPVRVSALSRADQLARALQAVRPDLPSTRDERLNEMDFGVWEGRPWQDIPKDAVDAWTCDFAVYRPGGGENVSDVLARVRQVLVETAAQREAVWITHAGIIRAVQYLATAASDCTPSAHAWPVQAPRCGEWTVLDIAV